MIRCEDCKSLILDHLYGLLDAPQAGEVAAHLSGCSACASAREEAARAQGLFARAAKLAFPRVQFVPPNSTEASDPRPAGVGTKTPRPVPAYSPSARKGNRYGAWAAWAIAASVLIAIPTTVIPLQGELDRAELARQATDQSVARASVAAAEFKQAVSELEERQAKLHKNLEVARRSQELVLAEWVAEEKRLAAAQLARKVTVDVVKPATVQPGAPNEFLLVLEDHGLAPKTRLVAEVRDQTDAVIHSQRLDTERRDNHHVVRLPLQAWTKLTPHSELFLVVSSVDEKTSAKTELQEKIRLFGPVYTTMLVTDRPTYHPGELLYFRSLTLDRVTFQPPAREQVLQYDLRGPVAANRLPRSERGGTELVRVTNGKVEPVLGPDGKAIRGVGCGAFALPADLPDGEYTLTVSELPLSADLPPLMRFPVSRTLHIRSGTVEAYGKRIGFSAASYPAGSTVEAWAELKFQGQPVAEAEVRAVAQAENLQLSQIEAPHTGPDGRTRIRFTLPRNPDLTDVRLKVTFKTKNGEESVAERVPLTSRKVIVEFFPEGGSLVAGLPSRVYVRGTTATGQPVDLAGVITDGKKELARVQTLVDANEPGVNRGIGYFEITPEAGKPAWLRLNSPREAIAPICDGSSPTAHAALIGVAPVLGLPTGFAMPRVLADGVVMHVANPVAAPGQPYRVQLHATGHGRNLVVGAYTRGRLSDTKRVSVQPGRAAEIELMADTDPRGGVVRITVFEEPAQPGAARSDLKPVAERLVYRKPGELLNLSYSLSSPTISESKSFPANTPINLMIAATDEKGRAAPAILWAAVVNAGLEPGRKDRLLTTHFLLAGEVSTPDLLEDADFLLTDHPRAGESLDLVLATQGWRRFVEQTPAGFLGQRNVALADPSAANPRSLPNSDRTRLLANNGQYPVHAELPAAHEHNKLYESFWPRYEASNKALAAAQAAHDAQAGDAATANRVRSLAKETQEYQTVAGSAAERSRGASDTLDRIRGVGWFGVAGFGLLGLILGALAINRKAQRLPYGIATLGALGLAAFLAVSLIKAELTQAGIVAGEEFARELQKSEIVVPSLPEPKIGEVQMKKTEGDEDAAPKSGDGNVVQNGPGTKKFASPMVKSTGVGAAPGGVKPGDVSEKEPRSDWMPRDSKLTISDSELERLNARLSGTRLGSANAAVEYAMMKRSSELARDYVADRARTASQRLEDLQRNAGFTSDKIAVGAPGANPRDANSSPEAKAMSRVREAFPSTTPLVVREFASPRPGASATSFPSETILWQPVIVLPGDGKLTIPLQLGASEGGYRIVIAGHTLDGRIGAVRGLIGISLPDAPTLTPAPLPTKKP
jgi:hypothetical protein